MNRILRGSVLRIIFFSLLLSSVSLSATPAKSSLLSTGWDGSNQQLISINTATGLSSVISTMDFQWTTGIIAVDSQNDKAYMMGSKDNVSWSLYTIDLSTGLFSSVPSSNYGNFSFYETNTSRPIPVGYSPQWLIITLLSLTIAGGLLLRRRIARRQQNEV
jgi:hypothetical protein